MSDEDHNDAHPADPAEDDAHPADPAEDEANPDLVPMERAGEVLRIHRMNVAEHVRLGWREA